MRRPFGTLLLLLSHPHHKPSLHSSSHTLIWSQRRNMAQVQAEQWKKIIPDNAPPFYVFDGAIQKSEQDDRDYRLIRLENGLKAMLIHDSKADKAAASLDVAVGHLDDPVCLIKTISYLTQLSRSLGRHARTGALLRALALYGTLHSQWSSMTN